MALAGLLGGIDPIALAGSFLAAIGCAVLGCSLALLLSVWGRKTSEVLTLTYLILIVWVIMPGVLYLAARSLGRSAAGLIGPTLWEWLKLSNPYYLAFAPYTDPGRVGLTAYSGFLAACLCLSGMLAAVATAGFARPPRSRPMPQPPHPSTGPAALARVATTALVFAAPGPVARRQPGPVARVAWLQAVKDDAHRVAVLRCAGCHLVRARAVMVHGSPILHMLVALMCAFQVALGLLLLCVAAATGLAEERVRGTLDVLLSTPLKVRSILVGKWWGAFRSVRFVMIWAALIAGAPLRRAVAVCIMPFSWGWFCPTGR